MLLRFLSRHGGPPDGGLPTHGTQRRADDLLMGLVIEPRGVPAASLTSVVGRRAARAALRSGESVSVRRGALVPPLPVGKHWQEAEGHALAMIASARSKLRNDAVVSHASAALVHGLWVLTVPDRPEVSQSTRPNMHARDSLWRHHARLASNEVTILDGLRVTTLERTVADCARTMHPRDALAVADSGMRAILRPDRRTKEADAAGVAELRHRLQDMVDTGPPRGRRQARAVLAAADPYAESPMETVLRWVAVSRGLPAPEVQMPVHTRGGTFYVDLGWRWVLRRADGSTVVYVLLLEYDGELKYVPGEGLVDSLDGAVAAVVAEKRREDLIRENPDHVIRRFSKGEVFDPDRTFARILSVIPRERRAELTPVPELLHGTALRPPPVNANTHIRSV